MRGILKNPEAKRNYGILSIAFFLFLIISLFISSYSLNLLKKEIVRCNTNIVGKILEKRPELEDEIIDIITKNNASKKAFNLGKETLEKYNYSENMKFSYEVAIKRIESKVFTINILNIVLISITIFIISTLILKIFYKEIFHIEKFTEKIVEGDFNYKLDNYSTGDIGRLKNNLVKMTSMMKEHIEIEKNGQRFLSEIISDISHQLKTPMTSLIMFNDLMEDENMNWNSRKEFLNNSKNQLLRMEWLIKSLLKLSKLDAGVVNFKSDKVNLNEILSEVIKSLSPMIKEKNQNIILIGDEKSYYLGDYNWSLEAFINIVKNCIEHTATSGVLEISYEDNELFAEIHIKDNGEGIKKEDLPHIFERFYKSSTSFKTESVGIGLALSKTIIKNQNGSITVKSELKKGTEFTIKFLKITL